MQIMYIIICHPTDSFSGLGIKAFLSTYRPWGPRTDYGRLQHRSQPPRG